MPSFRLKKTNWKECSRHNLSISKISDYRKQLYTKANQSSHPCPGCVSQSHSAPGSNDQSTKCTANCLNCNITNHFTKVCPKETRNPDSTNALIAQIQHDQQKDTYTSRKSRTSKEIFVKLKPAQSPSHSKFTPLSIFPVYGVSICLAGPKHLDQLGINYNNLFPCSKQVTAVGGSILQCSRWLPITFRLNRYQTNQPLFICDKIDQLYFSKQGCVGLNILPSTFPYSVNTTTQQTPAAYAIKDHSNNIVNHPTDFPVARPNIPTQPTSLPYFPTTNTIPKLEEYLKTQLHH